jgi:hypothetical protein
VNYILHQSVYLTPGTDLNALETTMSTLTVNSAGLHCEEVGTGPQTIVLILGLMRASVSFGAQSEAPASSTTAGHTTGQRQPHRGARPLAACMPPSSLAGCTGREATWRAPFERHREDPLRQCLGI